MIRISIFLLFSLATLPANADLEVYKCVDADGNVAYQQIPCPVVKEVPAMEVIEVIEVDEVAEEAPQTPVASNLTDEEIEACKDPLRDSKRRC